jgi:hypothetical protein
MTYSAIIPLEIADKLLAIRDSLTRDCWAIGDLTWEVIRYNQLNQTGADLQTIYAAVGMFAGKASRTVREYFALSRFYPPELRETFAPLAYDHFRHAACLGERAIEALQWAVSQDDLGRPVTVDMMQAHFSLPEPGEPEMPIEQGPGGLYSQIFRSVSYQLQAASGWLRGELPDDILFLVKNYHYAAEKLSQGLKEFEVEQ